MSIGQTARLLGPGSNRGLTLIELLIGILLQGMGLIASRDPSTVQPDSALTAIHLGVSIVPALVAIGVWFAFQLISSIGIFSGVNRPGFDGGSIV